MALPPRPTRGHGFRDRAPPLPPPPALSVEETVAGLVFSQEFFGNAGEKPSTADSRGGCSKPRLGTPSPDAWKQRNSVQRLSTPRGASRDKSVSAHDLRVKASDFRGYGSLDELLGGTQQTAREASGGKPNDGSREVLESALWGTLTSASSHIETAPDPYTSEAPSASASASATGGTTTTAAGLGLGLGLTSKLFGKVAANMRFGSTAPPAAGGPDASGAALGGGGANGLSLAVGKLPGIAATVKLRTWAAGAKHTAEGSEGPRAKVRRRSKASSTAAGGENEEEEEELNDNDVAHDLDNMLTGVGLSMKSAGMPEGWEAMLALIDGETDNLASKRAILGGRPKMKPTLNRIAQVASWRATKAVEDPELEAVLRKTTAEAPLPGQVGDHSELDDSIKDKAIMSVLPGCYTAIEERTQDVLDNATGVRGLPLGEYRLEYLKAQIQKPAWQKKLSLPASVLAEQEVPQGPGISSDASPSTKKVEEFKFQESEEDTETVKILEDQNRQYLAWRRRVIDCTRNLSTEANRFHFVD